ncbi:MAG TPA: TerD family protein [Acidobacteriota bacterium]|nr:TerD family protein [Acidobacteriota bacterium]HMZ78761.1 TerD family protein [Acidobacteriota bacterium]HNB71236.1 TerD family protein [Acidobacteriota bacterium]HNC44087.1 TerD family protein [Acidobacteriota bacterium]HND18598.1 TerD family protein [Acidobacteriota bacterium]
MSVSLQKGQKISLAKEAGATLTRVIMGLGWDAKKKGGFFGFGAKTQEIDLDASCLLFDQNKQVVDVVWFRQLRSRDGSIQHTGDNRTGQGEGDDEQIIVDLSQVPDYVQTIMFVVNSFTGQSFSEIENAFCRLVDQSSNREIAKYNLSCNGNHTAQIMAKLYRHNNEWKMHAIGENGTGRTFQELLPVMMPYV